MFELLLSMSEVEKLERMFLFSYYRNCLGVIIDLNHKGGSIR